MQKIYANITSVHGAAQETGAAASEIRIAVNKFSQKSNSLRCEVKIPLADILAT